MISATTLEPQRLFEVPYNFDKSVLSFYAKNADSISYLYLPPYKADSPNTRTTIQTTRKGFCYMPQTRDEYEEHLEAIYKAGFKFIILWQEPCRIIDKNILNYYTGVYASGFTIAQSENAKIIKEYNPDLIVIGSIVLRVIEGLSRLSIQDFDEIVMYYTFNRGLDAIKRLEHFRDKLVIIPNALCHTDCQATHHWFPKPNSVFEQKRDCPVVNDITSCSYIFPEHLFLFDPFICGYKLQGREYSTELLECVCNMYFSRHSSKDYLKGMLGKELEKEMMINAKTMSLEDYYNIKSKFLLSVI